MTEFQSVFKHELAEYLEISQGSFLRGAMLRKYLCGNQDVFMKLHSNSFDTEALSIAEES